VKQDIEHVLACITLRYCQATNVQHRLATRGALRLLIPFYVANNKHLT
jgi:hypothetical protein